MQMTSEKGIVERNGTSCESTFRIKASAKAFKILSDGLYSDKVKAIVRELGTNAADSHVMAGKASTPFLVHLPNRLEPHFSIRDYGVGLSEEQVETVYTTYFESDKTSSNDVTGCLGLGSKSPFSYTDSFTVVSYYDGKKLTYNAFINEYGIPSILKLAEEETSEANGVEVSFPVDDDDFYTFKEKAIAVYSYFTVKPEVMGQVVTFTEYKFDYVKDNWAMRYGRNGASLLMGNVLYPINISQIKDSYKFEKILRHVHVRINANIGDVDITASREAMEYNAHTQDYIKTILEYVYDNYETTVLAQINTKETYWEACRMFQDNSLGVEWSKASWKGKKLATSFSFNFTNTKVIYLKRRYGGKIRMDRDGLLTQLNLQGQIAFIENDLERGGLNRAKEYLRKQSSIEKVVYIKFADADDRQTFIDTLGLPTSIFIKVSTLPKITVTRTYIKQSASVFLFDVPVSSRRRGTSRNYWTRHDLKDVVGNCLYVELDNVEPQGISTYELQYVIGYITKITGKMPVVYGVRKNMLKNVQNLKHFVSVKDEIEAIKKKYAAQKNTILNASKYADLQSLLKLKNEMSGLDIGELCDKIELVKKNKDKYVALQNLFDFQNKESEKDEKEAEKELDGIKVKYPLLFWAMNRVEDWPVAEFATYLKLVNCREATERGESHAEVKSE